MVTNFAGIDDKSFNQGTWKGIKRSETESGFLAGIGAITDVYAKLQLDEIVLSK